MNIALGHIDAGPLIYGIVLALGVYSILYKMRRLMIVPLIAELATFVTVFSLHKGTMTGGMSAAIASLIVGLTITAFWRATRRR